MDSTPSFGVDILWYVHGTAIFLFLLHLLLLVRRNQRGIICHSHFVGNVLPFWTRLRLRHRAALLIGEPLLLFAVAGILRLGGDEVSVWVWGYFGVVGIGLLVQALMMVVVERQAVLDMLDRQIEGEQLARTVDEWREPGLSSTQGFVAPEFLRSRSRKERLDYLHALGKIDPALRDLIDAPPPAGGGEQAPSSSDAPPAAT